MSRPVEKRACEALKIATVERCRSPARPGGRYCGTHQQQHDAGTLMTPDAMRAKYKAVVDGLRAGRPRSALMSEFGLTSQVMTSWSARSGVAAERKQQRAEAVAREEQARREQEEQEARDVAEATEVAETVADLIRCVLPEFRTPSPLFGRGAPLFMFQPDELLDLLEKLIRPSVDSRLLPLGFALRAVLGHDVVVLRTADDNERAYPFDWGCLDRAEYGPDSVFLEFDDGWGFEEPDLAGVAIVTADGITIPYNESDNCLVIAIAEPAEEELYLELTGGLELRPDRDALVALATGPKPERPDLDEDDES